MSRLLIHCYACSQFDVVIDSYRLSWFFVSLVDLSADGDWLAVRRTGAHHKQFFSIVNHFFVIMCVFPQVYSVCFSQNSKVGLYIPFFTLHLAWFVSGIHM